MTENLRLSSKLPPQKLALCNALANVEQSGPKEQIVTAAFLVGTAGCDNKKDATVQEPATSAADSASDALKKTTAAVKETGAKEL